MSTFTSILATMMRPGVGINSRPAKIKPMKTLELYDMEGCPFCRITREVLTELDINAMIYPCPKRGARFRPKAIELGGKAQFPFLVDPNNDTQLYESADTIQYLYSTYAQQRVPLKWRLSGLQKLGSSLASGFRAGKGLRVRPSKMPVKPLQLYSFEGSPFARPVRELLTEMEIPYLLHSAGRSSWQEWLPPAVRKALNIEAKPTLAARIELEQRAGKVLIPYLIDPNTGDEMFESTQIIEHIRTSYGVDE